MSMVKLKPKSNILYPFYVIKGTQVSISVKSKYTMAYFILKYAMNALQVGQ